MNSATKFEKKIQLFQERLKTLRGEKSLQEVATALGISRATLGYYESGDRKPDIEMLLRIANYYNVSCDYLLGLIKVSSTNIDYRTISEKTGLCEGAAEQLSYMCKSANNPDDQHNSLNKLRLSTLNSLLYGSTDILDNIAYYINLSFDYFGDCQEEEFNYIPIANLELCDSKFDFHFSDDYDYLYQIFLFEIQKDLMFLRENRLKKRNSC